MEDHFAVPALAEGGSGPAAAADEPKFRLSRSMEIVFENIRLLMVIAMTYAHLQKCAFDTLSLGHFGGFDDGRSYLACPMRTQSKTGFVTGIDVVTMLKPISHCVQMPLSTR